MIDPRSLGVIGNDLISKNGYRFYEDVGQLEYTCSARSSSWQDKTYSLLTVLYDIKTASLNNNSLSFRTQCVYYVRP